MIELYVTAGLLLIQQGVTQTDQRVWSSVSAGDAHACALTVQGQAYCWNRPPTRKGARATQPVSTAVPGKLRFTSISAGNYTACWTSSSLASTYREFCFGRQTHHTCAITRRGEVYCWGGNSDGQLGDGTTSDRLAPARVAGDLTFASISAGDAHTCGVTTGHVAYCWGRNASGELGTGSVDEEPHPRPEVVAGDVRTIAAGGHFSCAVDLKSVAYCWGDNYQSRLGSSAADPVNPSPTPLPVDGGHEFSDISAGETHACGITRKGAAYCWGGNLNGEIGPDVALLSSSRSPVAVAGPPFAVVSAGLRFHTCALSVDRKAYCWGRNTEGQLGVGDQPLESCHSDPCSPHPVPVSGDLRFKSLVAGRAFTCGVTVEARLYCWGGGWSGGPESRAGRVGAPVLVRF